MIDPESRLYFIEKCFVVMNIKCIKMSLVLNTHKLVGTNI